MSIDPTQESFADTSLDPRNCGACGNVCPAGNESLKVKFATNTQERVPVVSAGVGARFLLSYIPIEVYYARPFQRPDSKWVFGFNIIPGW